MNDVNSGIIFSIEEFSVYDGPGIRTTVFFKGCPMRCNWCHNPEGLEPRIQVVKSPNGCLHCGACEAVCEHKDGCIACGKCIAVCPRNLIRFSGVRYTVDALVKKLMKNADYLTQAGGGVTFSGGECLMQADFLAEVLVRLKGRMHTAIQTCGYAETDKFERVLSEVDYVMFDLKVMDSVQAVRYTGRDNDLILKNFDRLSDSGVPFVVRVPLIPGVTDTEDNLKEIAERVAHSRANGVELLPYNKMAGSKYTLLGKEYRPIFDETKDLNIDTEVFHKRNIPVRVM